MYLELLNTKETRKKPNQIIFLFCILRILPPDHSSGCLTEWLPSGMSTATDKEEGVRYCNEFKQFPKGSLSHPVLEETISPCATNLPKAFLEDQDLSLCDLSWAHMPPLLRHHILLDKDF